ncbi:MAG: hypothetical protein WAO10_17805, partial [Candidatus Sulfotelmatobacter sp.]
MTAIDYNELLEQAFREYTDLVKERREIDWRAAQKEQFIVATINMLPDDKKGKWVTLFDNLSGEPVTLSDAIRAVLQAAPKKFHTATEVRDALRKNKFDFSQYTTNPLSSVHAALKRLKPEEAEVSKTEGVMAWRWKESARKLRRHKRKRNAFIGTYRGIAAPTMGLMGRNAYESTMFVPFSTHGGSLLDDMSSVYEEEPRIILPSEANKKPRT